MAECFGDFAVVVEVLDCKININQKKQETKMDSKNILSIRKNTYVLFEFYCCIFSL